MRITEGDGASAVLAGRGWMFYEIAGRTTMHAIMRLDGNTQGIGF
jgi:hypothetical protein